MRTEGISVVIVDDQELIRTGFALILSTAQGLEVVGEAASGDEALALLERLNDDAGLPDIVLMDVRMPGMNGIEATRRLIERFPSIRVLVLTTFDIDEYAMDAVHAGASGFLLKDARAAELIHAVRAVASGEPVIAASVTRRLMKRLRQSETTPSSASEAVAGTSDREAAGAARRLECLTEREREVFDLIAEGLSNAEIGARLFLSESTVKTHVGRVLAKLELRDRVHAVILAYQSGSVTSR